MKHNIKITLILLAMFVATQFIGIYVVGFYSPIKISLDGIQTNVSSPELPFGFQPPELKGESDFNYAFVSIILAFMISISLLLFLTKLNAEFFLRMWFFLVIVIALVIAFNVVSSQIGFLSEKTLLEIPAPWIFALVLALPLAYFKIYKRNFLIHNATELLVYPGIAAVFVPILNIYTISFLLILISIYDAWAVWHSGIMQKMAKYQINTLNVFSGFFIPYVSKKVKMQMLKMKKSAANSGKKVKVNVAILGGGDVVFPIITSGVVLKTFGFAPALFVVAGAALGLSYLFIFAEKKKFYPAMPFITAGIFAGIALSYLVF